MLDKVVLTVDSKEEGIKCELLTRFLPLLQNGIPDLWVVVVLEYVKLTIIILVVVTITPVHVRLVKKQ